MSLIRHIAGVPTATEQRCVRCCEVIQRRTRRKHERWTMIAHPSMYVYEYGECFVLSTTACGGLIQDCIAYDPHAGGELTEAERQALASNLAAALAEGAR